MSQEPLAQNSNGIEDGFTPEGAELPSEQGLENNAVGQRIREIRTQHDWTLKTLAEHTQLNINTLSMIENGKTSPSVGTLQRLARALDTPIASFFEDGKASRPIIFTAHDQRPESTCCQALIQNLGKDLEDTTLEPFVVRMHKDAGSGGRTLEHNGYEFAYCLSGEILYVIEEIEYVLSPGDSLLFAANLPHRWENISDAESQMILVMTPIGKHLEQSPSHFRHG